MEKKYLRALLSRFFENDFPAELKQRFAKWFVRPEQQEEKEQIMEDIWESLPVTTDLSSLEELKKVNKRLHTNHNRLFRRMATAAAIILLPLLGFLTATLYYNEAEAFQEVNMVECYVPNGQRKQVILPDGSKVYLNAGSVLIYPDHFGSSRTIYLSGEGNFRVEKDEKKPFIVKTNYISVEALGTVFNLQSYPGDSKTTTILESGKVKVEDITGVSGSVILNPEEQLIYDHADASFMKSYVDASRLRSWTDGYLIFQQETVNTIFRSMERRFNVKINYNDSKFGDMTFTVRFHADDTLQEALDVLRRIGVNFSYNIKNDDVYIQ